MRPRRREVLGGRGQEERLHEVQDKEMLRDRDEKGEEIDIEESHDINLTKISYARTTFAVRTARSVASGK